MGIDNVSAMVQANAATAGKNSAVSEEMSARAAALREEAEQFRAALIGAILQALGPDSPRQDSACKRGTDHDKFYVPEPRALGPRISEVLIR